MAVPLENSTYSTHQKLLLREMGLGGCGEGVEGDVQCEMMSLYGENGTFWEKRWAIGSPQP